MTPYLAAVTCDLCEKFVPGIGIVDGAGVNATYRKACLECLCILIDDAKTTIDAARSSLVEGELNGSVSWDTLKKELGLDANSAKA